MVHPHVLFAHYEDHNTNMHAELFQICTTAAFTIQLHRFFFI
jgi:hypothetical protein